MAPTRLVVAQVRGLHGLNGLAIVLACGWAAAVDRKCMSTCA